MIDVICWLFVVEFVPFLLYFTFSPRMWGPDMAGDSGADPQGSSFPKAETWACLTHQKPCQILSLSNISQPRISVWVTDGPRTAKEPLPATDRWGHAFQPSLFSLPLNESQELDSQHPQLPDAQGLFLLPEPLAPTQGHSTACCSSLDLGGGSVVGHGVLHCPPQSRSCTHRLLCSQPKAGFTLPL